MKIITHILQLRAPKCETSSLRHLKEYFENIPIFHQELWPFEKLSDHCKISYTQALVFPDKFGFGQNLSLIVECDLPNKHYVVSEKISCSNFVEIELNSVIGQEKENTKKNTFLYELIQSHRKFIQSETEGVLRVQAHSGFVGDIKTCGGYVWALHGFNFASQAELTRIRKEFQSYSKNHGLEISDKDLMRFKYPCHFAAFHAKQKVNGIDIGKAFLLEQTWSGQINSSENDKSEPIRYSKVYHTKGKIAAEKELSPSFVRMMRKYNSDSHTNNGWIHRLFGSKKGLCR